MASENLRIDSLDDVDNKILYALSINSRISYVEIAREVNLSRVAVKNRIENLYKSGVIESFTIVVNPLKIGRTLSVFMDLTVSPLKIYEVSEALASKSCVTVVYRMTGKPSLHVHAVFSSNENLDDFLRDEVLTLEGIIDVSTQIIVSRVKIRKGINV